MLQRELERSRRERKPVGVILGDVDHFKSVNDTLGHLFGDEALREIGRRLRAQLRVYDGVGRYGGEEFLMVLPNCDFSNALLRANELRECIAHTPVVCSGEEKTHHHEYGSRRLECDGEKRTGSVVKSG
jgi:two-component system cell cycle response regulator